MGTKNSKVINKQTSKPNEINAPHATCNLFNEVNDDVIEQLEDFNRLTLNERQESLIENKTLLPYSTNNSSNMVEIKLDDKQIIECRKLHYFLWCSCYAQLFQQNFKNWTSGNHIIDEFIQNVQLKAKNKHEVLEWIDYNKLKYVKYLSKGGFVYKAIWKDGPIEEWDSKNNKWKRSWDKEVALKYLIHNSQDNTVEFLRVDKVNTKHVSGITKDPKTNNFMLVMHDITGLCIECNQFYTTYWSHRSCNAQRFQQNFNNWTSGNHDIDEFIQNAQLKAKNDGEVLEWIEYDRFENVEYLAKGNFGTVYKVIWKDGPIEKWDSKNNQWKRSWNKKFALKCLNNSQDNTFEFLREIESDTFRCYGITKNPETNNFMTIIDYYAFKNLLIKHGVCAGCKKPNTYSYWCHSCNATRFQKNFKNWTSGNHEVDEYIKNAQLNAESHYAVLEWIEYDRFENVEYLAKGNFGTVYKVIWKDGPIEKWDSKNNQWKRSLWEKKVALKCLNNSQDNTFEFLREIESDTFRCYGITKNPETNNFMTIIDYYAFKNLLIKHGVCAECKKPNTDSYWCHSCNATRFQKNFKNWASGNHEVDEYIKNAQLNAESHYAVLEWIEYDRFENVEYLAKGNFGTVYKAIWKDGPIEKWDSKNNQWKRSWDKKFALECLNNSQDNTFEFLREDKVNVCGITKDPKTNNFMLVMHDITGLCIECNQLYTTYWSHRSCNAQRFQQNFNNWTSKNHDIDEFIKNAQLNANNKHEVLEWIKYDRFKNIDKGGFGNVYKAIWKDGPIEEWDSKNNKWRRQDNQKVALKCLHNSQDNTVEFLREIELDKVRCYGITKNSKTNNYMTVIDYDAFENWCIKKHGVCAECKKPNTDSYWCHSCNATRFQKNFKNWTSGNHDVDEFIKNAQLNAKNKHEVLEWIDYDRFENVEYLARGGFGTVYKAIWEDGPLGECDSRYNIWRRQNKQKVALKCLHNSQDITVEFLREIELHLIMNTSQWVVTCYGITKDPKSNNFMLVMKCAENGSLRQHLNNTFNSLDWIRKLRTLHRIADGLKNIHSKKLIHRDFHCGNILNILYDDVAIADLGLCQPANIKPTQGGDKKIYGVLPYVAPEVLKGKEYTQASDIYAFGIIAYETCTGLPPYHDMAHEEFLAVRICQGLRPKSNYKVPRLILDVIKQCWNADPLKRPIAVKLVELLNELYNNRYDRNALIYKQIKEVDEINIQISLTASLSSTDILSYATHPQAVYTSRLLAYKNLPEPKNADDIETEYSESTRVDFTKLNIKV